MGRHSLRLTVILGLLITALGSTGIFAVFSDRATAGNNDVTTGSLLSAADLKIAAAAENLGNYDCDQDGDGVFRPVEGPWADNTAAGQFTVSNLQPGGGASGAALCIYNAGAAPLTLTASAIELVDLETACTGDEAAAGDTSCGLALPGQPTNPGELSSVLMIDLARVTCNSIDGVHQEIGTASSTLASLSGLTLSGPSLQPGVVACVVAGIRYPSTTSTTDQQRAQSDSSHWRFAFDGVAP